jgi:hypothetical protein
MNYTIIKEAIKLKDEYIKNHPKFKNDIISSFNLFIGEIREDESSVEHEYNLFVNDLKDIVE